MSEKRADGRELAGEGLMSDPTASVSRIAAWAGLLVGLLFLIFVAGTWGPNAYLPVRAAGQAVTFVLLAGWLLAAWRVPAWRPTSSLVPPLAGCLVILGVSALASPYQRAGVGALVTAGALAAGLLGLNRMAAHAWFGIRLKALLLLLPIAIGVGYGLEVMATWSEWWRLVGSFAIPPLRPAWADLGLGSPNLVATVMLLTTPPAVALMLTNARRHRWPAVAVLVLLGFLAIVASGSRGGMLGAGAALAISFLAVAGEQWRLGRRLPMRAIVAVGAGLSGLALLLVVRMSQGGTELRVELWRASLAMFLERPLLGQGPGSWAVARLEEWQPWVVTLVVPHAHNIIFQTIAELGILGSLAVAWLVAAVARLVLRGLRAGGSARMVAAGIAVGLLGVAAQSTVDVVTNVPAVVLIIAMMLAVLEACLPAASPGSVGRPPVLSTPRWIAVGSLACIVMLGGVGVWAVRTDLAMVQAERARSALEAGNSRDAASLFDRAWELDPLPLYAVEGAAALAYARDPAAGRALEGSTALEALPHHLVALGYVALAEGRREDARAAAAAAIDRGWPDPNVLLNAGRVAEQAGDLDLAAEAYVRAAAAAPTSLGDPWWRSLFLPFDTLIQRAARVALDHAGPTPGDDVGRVRTTLVLAFGGDVAGAREALENVPADQRETVGAVLVAQRDVGAGIEMLLSRLAQSPLDWRAAGWLARLYEDLGRTEDAAKYARWAVIVQADAARNFPRQPRRVGDAMGVPQFRLGGNYPWPLYFRNADVRLLGPDALIFEP